MPNLAEFATELPVCCPSTPLATVVSLCVQHSADWIVLLDDQQTPLGVLRLVQVLSRMQRDAEESGVVGAHRDLLQPVDWLAPEQALESLWPQLVDDPNHLWGVAGQGAYRLLDPARLLKAALNRPAALPREELQAITDCLNLPSSIQNRSRPVVCNEAWRQTFGDRPTMPTQQRSWQLHRLPLMVSAAVTPLADPANGELWLVVASPDGPDAAVLNGWLTGVSHELKSPLTSLLSLSTLLQDQRLGQLNAKQRHYVDLVQQTVRRLVATINQLLDWVRLDSGQLTLKPTAVNLQALWPEVLQQLHEQGLGAVTEAQLAAIDWTVPPDRQTVVADPIRLRQILAHLLGYCLTRDQPGDCAGLVEGWGGWMALTISDQQALPVSQQSRLFHPQGFSSGLSRLELGPALAWHLTRLHGGDITFTSSAERGSQFTVLLPAETETETCLLLLVADNADLIDQVVVALHGGICRVAIARSLPEALDKTTRLQPAVVLVTPLLDQPNPLDYLRQRLGPYPPILSLTTQPNASSHREDTIILEALGYPLPPSLQKALQLDPRQELTVLHLCSNLPLSAANPETKDLGSWLRRYHCRVLEVDDPLQADLLSRVWQPDVMILDAEFPDPRACIAQISELPHLSRCPLVVLTAAAAAAANQFPQLRWRAYLQPDQSVSALGLMQVLHEAMATTMG